MKLNDPLIKREIINATDSEYLENIAKRGLEMLDTNPKITLVYAPKSSNLKNYTTKVNDEYFVYIDRNEKKNRQAKILAHELAHVKQYESGDLILDHENRKGTWKGKDYHFDSVPYENRPWENRADKEGRKILKHIRLNNIKENIKNR